MQFTYDAYKKLICLLKAQGYEITNYQEYKKAEGKRCVILRHDIDNSIQKAWEMAKLEHDMGVCSTWFLLCTSEFYNPAAAASRAMIKEIHGMGHSIGLHFDETAYPGGRQKELKEAAEKERKLLEAILELPIREISMHRPSKNTLEADWRFETMTNSYSTEFFTGFKYVSDSWRHWREDVEAIIKSCQYDRLHILTHAFWYEEKEGTTRNRLLEYIRSAAIERYDSLNQNFRDLPEFVQRTEIL